MKKFVLIDSNALVHRAFHALPPSLTSPKGQIVNAVYGFTSVLLKMLKELKPDYVAATFDLAGPTFRHEEFEEYKAHRVKAPDELYAQIPPTKEILAAFGIPIFELQGFEADDLIGTLAEQAKKNKELQTIIVTGDMDTLQLVQGEKVIVFTLRKGITDTVTYDEKEIKKRYGLKPSQVADLKGLKGDPSDNIPGVPGVGEKTAGALIEQFGSIENMYAELERFAKTGGKNKKPPISEKLIEKLTAHKDMAFFSKKLATIVRTVPVKFDLAGTQWQKNLELKRLEDAFRGFGFFSLLKRIPEALGQAAPMPEKKTSAKAKLEPETQSQLTLLEPQRIPSDISKLKELVGHDLKPLIKPVIARGGAVPKELFDTRVAAYLLNPDLRQYDLAKIYYNEFGQGDVSDAYQAAVRLK
ncbi:MAG: hypothetical protein L0312_15940, partial [Acidobacteria bacterium]|nr:hypothetical protein [Acidobacteriota bacterium]